MHPALERTDHRPWPLPASPWRWRQVWHDLLFIHWPVPAEVLKAHVPPSLTIDERGGSAWLSLVPFHMSDVTLRGVPALPWLSAFAEMNLRTYVTLDGKPGVWFLRMDAERALAVWTARFGLGLPYVWSSMRVAPEGRPELVIYVENAGDFVVPLAAVDALHAHKVILNCGRLGRDLRIAIGHAHDAEEPDA